jgi:hypothetical protein
MNVKKNCGIILTTVVILFSIPRIIFAQPKYRVVNLKVNDILSSSFPQKVEIQGYLGERIDSCIKNSVMNQNIERLVRPFRLRFENNVDFWDWRCEFWGKWFTSAMMAYSYQNTAEHRSVIERGIADLLKNQSPDGYIGTYERHHRLQGWDIWGIKYTLLGLIAYYNKTKEYKVLNAACKDCHQVQYLNRWCSYMNKLETKNILILQSI